MEYEAEFDFWDQRLGINCGGYNSEVDQQIYDVAKMIVDARKSDTSVYMTDIAQALGISNQHAELIQYILAGVCYPVSEEDKKNGERFGTPFTYGTSPRGLFVDNERAANLFLEEFEEHLGHWEKEL